MVERLICNEKVRGSIPLKSKSSSSRVGEGDGSSILPRSIESNSMLPKNIEISSEEVVEKIKNNEDISFLDVRREEEYKNGHLKDAVLIPLIELSSEKLEQKGIGKDAEVIVYCGRGVRSETACEMLNEWGYKVRHLTGGLENFTKKEIIVK